jgi:hypothetical protein
MKAMPPLILPPAEAQAVGNALASELGKQALIQWYSSEPGQRVAEALLAGRPIQVEQEKKR